MARQRVGAAGGFARALTLSSEARREAARRAARIRWDMAAGLGDTTATENRPSAILTFGLRVDHPWPKSIVQRKGAVLPKTRARYMVCALRAEQVGAYGTTLRDCYGRWAGAAEEHSMQMEIVYFPSASEPTVKAFRLNMMRLAERIAEALGQIEVHGRIGAHSGTGETYFRSTPPGRPIKPLPDERRVKTRQ